MDVKGRKGFVDPFRFNEQEEEQDPNRKKYRTPKRDIVTKAYTINQESK